jgi:hypothetical protein
MQAHSGAMKCFGSRKPTHREQILLDHHADITPIEKPLFAWPDRASWTPNNYLSPHSRPFGSQVAKWQDEFFSLENSDYRTEPDISPIQPDAPTLIVLYYPDDDVIQRRTTSIYLDRIKTLAAMNEQIVFYTPPSISHQIRSYRNDKHWHVIDDYETVWDFPNNRHQHYNFSITQPKLFEEFDGYTSSHWKPNPAYNHPHRSATYSAKAFVTYDAVMRNPFGSKTWMYIDAGFFDGHGPLDAEGKLWDSLLSSTLCRHKIDRSINIGGDTGIVISEYLQDAQHGVKDINHECWTDSKKAWMCHQFIANAYVGSSLGMLNYSVRFMQTVDDMGANQRYTGREEFVIPWVAIRYPNTVFSIPWYPVPRPLRSPYSPGKYLMKAGCYSTYGGADSVSAIVDPISTIYCKGYVPRQPNLEAGGIYNRSFKSNIHLLTQRYRYLINPRVMADHFKITSREVRKSAILTPSQPVSEGGKYLGESLVAPLSEHQKVFCDCIDVV